jgi:hypothetical protein
MSVIVNITAFNCSSNTEAFSVSNSGWTTNSTSEPFGTDVFRVQNSSSPVSAYPDDAAPSFGYLNDATPGSANQTVRATYYRRGTLVTDQFTYIAARMSSGDDWIAASYCADSGGDTSGRIVIVTCIDGSRLTVFDQSSVGALGSTGASGILELVVSGQSPNISALVKWNGSQVGSTVTGLSGTQINGIGKVGFFNRVEFASEAGGTHLTTFYAEDDTASGTALSGSAITGGVGTQVPGLAVPL